MDKSTQKRSAQVDIVEFNENDTNTYTHTDHKACAREKLHFMQAFHFIHTQMIEK